MVRDTSSEAFVNELGEQFFFLVHRHMGRRGLSTREGACACGYHGELLSYETRVWIAMKHVPIIPRYRARITDYCPKCRRYQEMPLRKWRLMQKRVLQETLCAVRTSPTSKRTAHLALDTADQYVGNRDWTELADLIAHLWANDADMLLRASRLYEVSGAVEESRELLDKASALGSRPSAELANG